MKTVVTLVFSLLMASSYAQTLYVPNVPSSTGGISTSTIDGNVGIGTSQPSRRLEITGTQADFKVRHSSEQAGWGLHIEQKSNLTGVIACSGRDLQVTSGWTNSLILGSPEFTQYNGKVLIPGGKFGIGTSAPHQALHVTGRMYLEGTDYYPNGSMKSYFHWRGHSLILGTEEGQYAHNIVEIKPGGSTSGALESNLQLFSTPAPNDFRLKILLATDGNSFFNGGNVGIGTTAPDAKLAVKGDIHTREVRVDITGAMAVGDYVFEKNYNLTPLTELETYVNQNKHLPGVPSAKEFERDGMKLKEMNLLLLKKVEELTLYMIELEKKNKEQDKLINSLLQKEK